MPKLETTLERISKENPFVFNFFKNKLERDDPDFFDNLAMFYGMAGLSLSEYMNILKEEHRRFVHERNRIDMS